MLLKTYQSQLEKLHKAKMTPLVWGRHGIGKSSAYVNYYTVNCRLGNWQLGDLVGFPVERDGSMSFLAPDWWVALEKYCRENSDKMAVLHLDEINLVRRDMQSLIFQLVLDREINGRKLPDNCMIAASANPPTKDYPGVFDFQNLALIDRFCHITLDPSMDEWAEWAVGAGLDKTLIKFYQNNPQYLETVGEGFDATRLAKPSRRSAEFVDRLEKLDADREILEGVVGVSAYAAWVSFREDESKKFLKAADVFKYTAKTKERVKKLVEDREIAEIGKLIEEVANDIKIREEEISASEAKGVAAFLMDLSPEQAYAAALVYTQLPHSAFALDYDKCPDLFKHFQMLIDTQQIPEDLAETKPEE